MAIPDISRFLNQKPKQVELVEKKRLQMLIDTDPVEGIELIQSMLDSAKERFPEMIQTIQESLTKNDFSACAFSAHALKSASANLGAIELSNLASFFEENARIKNGTSMKLKIAQLQKTVVDTLDLLEKIWIK